MRIFRYLLTTLLFFVLAGSCGPADESTPAADADAVIERAVRAHGLEDFGTTDVSFTFRERDYRITTDGGSFRYTRQFVDSTGNRIHDQLDNDGLRRTINDTAAVLSAKDSAAYARSVNSVRYFFMLPYGLRDPSVNTRLLDTLHIRDAVYDQVEVTFDAEGGGTDFDDVYRYFFNRETGELDFLAYTFEVNEGGLRFREAVNKRRIDGVLVQDYVNYGVDGEDRDIATVGRRFREGKLPRLSVIENTAVTFHQ
ncbi:DUF6503 family protein [Lewinella sp. JB7]|uniref:DUF6503 family protein n=1 Tax=Lewinella sp. JB7 TaxID=2962887 RepID=UPI0020C9A8ED|nr:DUF6503 family protein [Lewinella sp. JB7]MCP9235412.1 hypothetical protein [Lewinella sp. JB7]